MSTFTALTALDELGRLDRVRLADAARFAKGLQHEGGGFRGVRSDHEVDVEYSFYGLGVIGLLGHRAQLAAGTEGRRTCDTSIERGQKP
jgi:geranylgeranyl transferase type-2 subunit beta